MPGENQSQVTILKEEATAASGLSRIISDHLKEPCNSAQGFQVAVFDKVTQWRGIHHATLRHPLFKRPFPDDLHGPRPVQE